jgi:catechol 2,3-dioxygenase-like lactoylglutathione lyase family enzyme
MAKTSGILGVDHVAVFTSKIEQAEAHYGELFGATVLFRGATHRGTWVGIDAAYGWGDIRKRGIRVQASFLRAGAVTIIVSDEPAGDKTGALNHVGIGCSDAEFRRIKDLVRAKGLRVVEEGADGFKFIDELGLIWDVNKGMDAAKRPEKMLDIFSGRIT